jgi:hypothetical protein
MLAKVVGVAFVSDPGRRLEGKESWWRSAQVVNGNLTVYTLGIFEPISGGIWSLNSLLSGSANGPLPDSIASKTTALCHNRDMVCAFYPGSTIGQHTNYTDTDRAALARASAA